MMRRMILALILSTALCFSVTGCGNSYDLAPVWKDHGRRPTAAIVGHLSAHPGQAGVPSSIGVTDAQGNYSRPPQRRPQSGPCPDTQVSLLLLARRPQSGKPLPQRPRAAKKAAEAKLTFDVPASGATEANFEL